MAIYQCSPPRLFSFTAARAPLARDAGSAWTPGIQRVRLLPRTKWRHPRMGHFKLSAEASRAWSPLSCLYTASQPRLPAAALSGPGPSWPQQALYPAVGLKHHLAVRVVDEEPPFPMRALLWLPALGAPGDTCLEQRSSICGKSFSKSAFKRVF